jgi:hypothetical protein
VSFSAVVNDVNVIALVKNEIGVLKIETEHKTGRCEKAPRIGPALLQQLQDLNATLSREVTCYAFSGFCHNPPSGYSSWRLPAGYECDRRGKYSFTRIFHRAHKTRGDLEFSFRPPR